MIDFLGRISGFCSITFSGHVPLTTLTDRLGLSEIFIWNVMTAGFLMNCIFQGIMCFMALNRNGARLMMKFYLWQASYFHLLATATYIVFEKFACCADIRAVFGQCAALLHQKRIQQASGVKEFFKINPN